MPTFGAMANRIIVDASLQRFGMTAAMVLPWLVSAYEDLLTGMPMGETTRQLELSTQLTGPYSEGTINITTGDDVITGVGTTFQPHHTNWFLRIDGTGPWYRVGFIDSTHLRVIGFGVSSPVSSNGLSYVLAARYGPEPTGLRWITQIRLTESPMFHEVSVMDLDSMFPERDSNPSLPLYWAKGQWSTIPPYRRYIELYPPPDQWYYVTVRGYHFIDEPTLQTYPYAGINEQIIIEGGLAHTFDFVAGQLSSQGTGTIEQVRAALDVAQRHRNVFEDLKLSMSRRDDRDTKGPKVSLAFGNNQQRGKYHDPTMSAYWEVWRR